MLIPFTPETKDLLAALSSVSFIEEVSGQNGVYTKKESFPNMTVITEPKWFVPEVVVETPITQASPPVAKTSLDEDVPF